MLCECFQISMHIKFRIGIKRYFMSHSPILHIVYCMVSRELYSPTNAPFH